MNFFKDSTQNKKWIISKENLEKDTCHKINQVLKKISDLNNAQMKAVDPSNPSNEISIINKKKFINPIEETYFIVYFTDQLLRIINSNEQPRSLKTYALTYFRRFFLKKTVHDYDPDYLLCAALFLGGKVAQLNINFDKMKKLCPFLNEVNPTTKRHNFEYLRDYEFYLSIILNYDFYVFCPYKAMAGFIYQLKQSHIFFTDNTVSASVFESECEKKIDKTFLTNLIFKYNYSLIALSCIVLTAEDFKIPCEMIANCIGSNWNKFDYQLFLKEKVPDVKSTLDEVKIIDDNQFREYKKKVLKVAIKYPQYVKKLEDERKNLLKKMNDFEMCFIKGIEDENNNENKQPKQNMIQINTNTNMNSLGFVNNIIEESDQMQPGKLINNKRARDPSDYPIDNDKMDIDS